eukprot:TRINITY_DN113971_c0_g1_i1.p1 TRINITY_DN113971_c0_g1~~TRINITY_DN113971_c0_g1_i1.p1  ORF type:complete len:202 (+),score=16.75 TRINITY_DN113971_c0_g1_i1:134-739(+)
MHRSAKNPSERKPKVKKSYYEKTVMCSFHAAGICERGSRCTFAHCESELVPQRDFSKTRICQFILKSRVCPRGDACTFAHSQEEVVSSTAPRQRMPKLVPSVAVAFHTSVCGMEDDGTLCFTDGTDQCSGKMPPPASSVPYPRFLTFASRKECEKTAEETIASIQWLGRGEDLMEDLQLPSSRHLGGSSSEAHPGLRGLFQ